MSNRNIINSTDGRILKLNLPGTIPASGLPKVDFNDLLFKFRAPVASHLRGRFFKISKLGDGKGLSAPDFATVVQWCMTMTSAVASQASKASIIEKTLLLAFPATSPWAATILVGLAYQFAKQMKYIK